VTDAERDYVLFLLLESQLVMFTAEIGRLRRSGFRDEATLEIMSRLRREMERLVLSMQASFPVPA